MDAFDLIELDSPEVKPKFKRNNGKGDAFDHLPDMEPEENFGKSALRTALQPVQGFLATTTPGLAASFWQLLATGEAYDPEEIERIRAISEREGIPFDEEKYLEAAENALKYIPTISNIGRQTEEKTGVPLEPKTRLQKGLRFATEAARVAPEGATLRPSNVSLPKPVLGAGVEGTKELLTELGVPEGLSDIASFGILKMPPEGSASLKIGESKKPSGLTEMQFEKTKTPRDVSQKKINQISQKLEKDFKDISNKIIKESPIGETAENLKKDPGFKQESRELLSESQKIADTIPKTVKSKDFKKELIDSTVEKVKGFSLNEYDKSYSKFIRESLDDVFTKEMTAGDLVKQYRKNNESLSEYFEPGSSKALNRAKKDALLDSNRAIARVIEKNFSDTELPKIFKEGNERWTKIMDAEAVDDFLGQVFSEKISYKKMHDFFDKQGYGFKFKRALGKEGFNKFETLMKDMLTTEAPFKMLNVAKEQGYKELFHTGLGYILHPKIGYAKAALDTTKYAYKALMDTMLDKPKVIVTWSKAVKDLKKGDFKSAENGFSKLQKEVDSSTS